MKAVLFFHHYNNYSGSTKVLSDIIKYNYNDSKKNLIITDNTKEGFLTGLDTPIINVPILRINNRAVPVISQVLWLFIGFIKAIRYGREYDVFYINTIVPCYASLAAKIMNKQIIYHVHEKFHDRRINHIVSEYVFNHTIAKRIFVSYYLESQYPKRSDCPSYVEYNKLTPEFVSKITRKDNKDRNYNSILLISALLEEKGLLNYRNLAKLMPEYHFVLVVGADESQILPFFNNDIPSNMKVYPKQTNIHPFLYESDVVLNMSIPSKWIETFGLTIIEAMAYGLPTIVPNVGGPVELVKENETGFPLDVEDLDIVASHIRYILSPDNYQRISQNALNESKKFIMK